MTTRPEDTCPGCTQPKGGQICCDECWDRPPTNLPNAPRWRSTRRHAARRGMRYNSDWDAVERIDAALTAWLTEHRIAP